MNPIVHFELPFKVGIRVRTFYQEVFGWKTEQLGPEMGDYILATHITDETSETWSQRTISGRFYPCYPSSAQQQASFVIAVDCLQLHMEKICRFGGQVLGDPYKIPGMGLQVTFIDTEGNRLSILEKVNKSLQNED